MAVQVWVVDDNAEYVELIQTLLELEGYVVDAIDPALFFDHLSVFQPDMIMLDIRLGVMDGLEVCQTLKTQPQTAHIPVILVSGQVELRQAAYEWGADAFLAKPFDLNTILKVVHKFAYAY